MSALSYLCGYGYGSNSDSDCEYENTDTKRTKLPLPDLSKVSTVSKEVHVDDPEQHEGRTRSFPHVRGNWASFVYVKFPEEKALLNLINKLQDHIVFTVDESCQKCADYHISLSRTVLLKYHLITPFTTSLQTALEHIESFSLIFESLKVYCNEENNRTFVALKVDHCSNKSLLQITNKVNEILSDFSLPTFYDDPSFHMSILWINGNKKAELENIIEKLNDIVAQEFENSFGTVPITKINCKSGNKNFQYSLG